MLGRFLSVVSMRLLRFFRKKSIKGFEDECVFSSPRKKDSLKDGCRDLRSLIDRRVDPLMLAGERIWPALPVPALTDDVAMRLRNIEMPLIFTKSQLDF